MKPEFLPRYWLVKAALYCPNTTESPLGMDNLPTGYEQEPATPRPFHGTPGSNRSQGLRQETPTISTML